MTNLLIILLIIVVWELFARYGIKLNGKPAFMVIKVLKLIYRKRLTSIEYKFERAYKDDDQIYEQFAKQCIADMRADIDKLEKELLDE